jgi:acetyl-CoA synthetase
MPWEPIHKSSQTWSVPPNLLDYDQTCATFSWQAVEVPAHGLLGGRGLNIAHEAVDRHANGAWRAHLALRWLGQDGSSLPSTSRRSAR